MSASMPWFVIINPTSGNGSSQKKWPRIKALLKTNGFDFKYAFTEYSNHSFELIQNAVNQGFKNIICIGGDGTLHNIVNGIMTQSKVVTTNINVGVIPIGTGNDWVKTHHIPNDIEKAIQIIKNRNLKHQDIGAIERDNSNPVFFSNLAGIGFDGYVVSKVGNYKSFGAVAYLLGALIGLFSFKNFNAITRLNSKAIRSKNVMILIGICQYSGGGMRLTKSPDPFDGLFDVSIAKDLSKIDIIKNISRLFSGSIVNHNKVENFKTSKISVEITDGSTPFIQADGELIGTGPMKIRIVPKAFSFYC